MTIPTEPGAGGTRTLDLIRARRATMSKAEQRIAACILDEPAAMVRISITELAERAGVGEATVSRFCRRLGLQGFLDLKISIATEALPAAIALDGDQVARSSPVTGPQQEAARIAALLDHSASLLDPGALVAAAQALSRAGRIDVYGQGASAVAALDAQHALNRFGLVVSAPQDTHTQAMSAALLKPGDVSLAFSHGGSSKDVVSTQQRARRNGAKTICITGAAHSPLVAVSDIVLLTAAEDTLVSNIRRRMIQLFALQLLLEECARIIGHPAREALERTTAAIVEKMY